MNDQIKCAYCGTILKKKLREGQQKAFCNKECKNKWQSENKPWNYQANSIIKCDICGKEFQRPKNKIGEHNYCSRECYFESKRKQVGELHPLYDRVELTCDTCGKKINKIPSKVERSENHFCSLECKYSWNGGAKEGYKICFKCKEEFKASNEYFYKNKYSKDGLAGICRKCSLEKSKIHYPKFKHYIKEYQEKNKEKIVQYRKKYYSENIDKIRANYEKNKEKYNETKAIYYQKNKEKFRECSKAYNKIYFSTERGKEIQRAALNRRRSRLKALPYDFTIRQWENAKKFFNYQCAYCGMTEEEHYEKFNEQLHQEHFIAATNGGAYSKDNIIPACRSCNGGKKNKDFFEWYPQQQFYDQKKEKKILKYIEVQKNKTLAKELKTVEKAVI